MKRSRMIDLEAILEIELWCHRHPVGFVEHKPNGEVWKRVEKGYEIQLVTKLKMVSVTGTITIDDEKKGEPNGESKTEGT